MEDHTDSLSEHHSYTLDASIIYVWKKATDSLPDSPPILCNMIYIDRGRQHKLPFRHTPPPTKRKARWSERPAWFSSGKHFHRRLRNSRAPPGTPSRNCTDLKPDTPVSSSSGLPLCPHAPPSSAFSLLSPKPLLPHQSLTKDSRRTGDETSDPKPRQYNGQAPELQAPTTERRENTTQAQQETEKGYMK